MGLQAQRCLPPTTMRTLFPPKELDQQMVSELSVSLSALKRCWNRHANWLKI